MTLNLWLTAENWYVLALSIRWLSQRDLLSHVIQSVSIRAQKQLLEAGQNRRILDHVKDDPFIFLDRGNLSC